VPPKSSYRIFGMIYKILHTGKSIHHLTHSTTRWWLNMTENRKRQANFKVFTLWLSFKKLQWTFRLHTVAEFLTSPAITNLITMDLHVISSFRREEDENCALLSCYTASSGDSLPTFRDSLSVPTSGVHFLDFWLTKMRPLVCPERSVRN